MNINISKQYKYLGEVPEFKENGLPSGFLIDKGKVGCGGTSLALEDNRNTIICVPFVSLIKNKMYKYNTDDCIKVLGVYEGVSKSDIKKYIANTSGAKKIMCTYDSLQKVAEVTGYDYYLLVDELHLLFIQYVFRNKAVKTVLNLYKNFSQWSFLTATPIEADLMLEELKDIPTYKVNWEDTTEISVKAIKCKQVLASIKTITKDFLEGRVFGNAHIFVNSVETIASIIKACNLDNSNTRIIFSKNNQKYKNVCQGVNNGNTTDQVKKINLYTSTCFEGCDLFDEEGKIYIISEGNKANTLYDISTQIRQIAGRIRNTHYTSITHLYSSTRYNTDLTFDDYKKVVLEEEKKAKSYITKVNNDEEIKVGTKLSTYAYVYKDEETGIFEFDPNLMKLDIFNYKCLHHTYSLSANISNEYTKAGMNVVTSIDNTSDKLLKNDRTRTTFKDAVIEYDSIMKRKAEAFNYSFTDDERIKLLTAKYPYIDDAYQVLGMDKLAEMKYKTSNIQQLLIKESPKLDNKAKVAKLLKTAKGFVEGAFITGADIKRVLGEIYKTIGMNVKPSIDDFRDFAVIDTKQKKIEGKNVRGYIIQYIKIK